MVNVPNPGMTGKLKIKAQITRFIANEYGAVSVDWVVLTAGVVGLVLGIFTILGNDTADYGERIGTFMSSQGIKTY